MGFFSGVFDSDKLADAINTTKNATKNLTGKVAGSFAESAGVIIQRRNKVTETAG